jgi:hypothetical protein
VAGGQKSEYRNQKPKFLSLYVVQRILTVHRSPAIFGIFCAIFDQPEKREIRTEARKDHQGSTQISNFGIYPSGRNRCSGSFQSTSSGLNPAIHRDHRGLRTMILFRISGVALITDHTAQDGFIR